MKFHEYLKQLRIKQFKDTKKMCIMLGITKETWRKIERGINPPPRQSILKKFCILVAALSYEQAQLFSLARRWEPHADTYSGNHTLLNKDSNSEWTTAITQENTPDYEHKYWGKRKP
ncbi:MAG TPA: hypothetical protein EYG21_02935 [Nitrospinaceae bacterium]|jgi:transcriptional regulator with XRE-family HTH domain|nr:hypothetical protein [Nitrospinaceae bacterium]